MTRETGRAGLRGRARRLGFGLATLAGLKPLGFFIPYRYAAGVVPRGYPALEPLLEAKGVAFRDLIAAIEDVLADLRSIASGRGPARFDQDWFPRLDAAAAYAIVRRERPARIVEIGSGHSTRFLAQAVADGGLATSVTAIDPAPRARLAGLALRHVPQLLADADRALFETLGAGDILFVDSSHVAMPGSDVDILVGEVLPRLRAGTLLHVHDIFLPDAYPAAWGWRGYNEATVVAALLAGGGWDVVFASHWVATRHPGWLQPLADLPLRPGARETSLWLRKR